MKPATLTILATPLAFALSSASPAAAQSVYSARAVTEYVADGTTYLTDSRTSSAADNADSRSGI